MAKTTIDLDDYAPPAWEDYVGDDPRTGWYTFKLERVSWYDEEAQKLQWVFTLQEEPYQGWPGMIFADFGNTKWLNQQVIIAIQGGAEKPLTCDFSNEAQVTALVKRSKLVRGKVEKRGTGEDARVVLRKVRPLLEEAGKAKAKTGNEDLTTADPEPPAEDNTPYTQEELDQMAIEDLVAILREDMQQDVPAKGRRESEEDYGAKLADLILAVQEQEGGEGDPEPDADDNGDDFGQGEEAFADPEPDPEPAPARRRAPATKSTAPPAKKAAPAAAPAATTTRRRRG